MTCDEREQLLGAYIDGELDLTPALEIENHLRGCKLCSATLLSLQTMKKSLSAEELLYSMPKSFQDKMVQTINRQRADADSDTRRFASLRSFVLGFAALLLLSAGLVSFPRIFAPAISSHESQLADEVIANHVRSLMGNHLLDVVSTDQSIIKPWFDGKLDFAPAVASYASEGFPLIGGRLDYMDNRPVAALVYRHDEHVINVFEWPSSANEPSNEPHKSIARRGYSIEYWRSNGMTFWVVSDVKTSDLATLCSLL